MQRVLHMKFDTFILLFFFVSSYYYDDIFFFINRRHRTCSVLCFKFKWNR